MNLSGSNVTRAQSAKGEAPGQPTSDSETKRPRVLVADDDRTIRELVRVTLGRDRRFIMLAAADGQEALDIARQSRPAVAVLDVRMPFMDGFEVCEAIRNDPDLEGMTIVMLTSLGEPADVERGNEAGADEYLLKPFSPKALREIVTRGLGFE